MRYRKFGKTGLTVSEVVFGGGAVGGILINASDDVRRRAVRMALDGGIDWIDTAPGYGNGKSEAAIGWLLKELPPGARPRVSTKVRLERGGGDFRGQIERSIEQSLKRLQMGSVELIQLHNPVTASPEGTRGAITPDEALGRGGVADVFDGLRSQGLTRHIGITATGEAPALKRVISSGRFGSAQVYYNLLNPTAGRAAPAGWEADDYGNIIATANEYGVAVMVIRALAAGVIATDVRHGREGGLGGRGSVSADEAHMQRLLPLLGPELGTRAQVAVRYALSHPGVSCVVVGLAELEHLRLAIEASDLGPLPGDVVARLERVVDGNWE